MDPERCVDVEEAAAPPPEEPAQGDAVLHALQKARFNELVHLEVQDGNEAREVCLVACLDEENGGVIWNPMQPPTDAPSAEDDPRIHDGSSGATDSNGIQRHIRTKRWVLPMLNDQRRNELYHLAISRAVDHVTRRLDEQVSPPGEKCGKETKEVSVLDIGSGSGLLSMMAAQSILEINKTRQAGSASPGNCCLSPSVVSVEMSSAMADLARQIVRDNKLDDHIHIFNAHSSEVVLPPRPNSDGQYRRADLCVSELLESGLLGEGLLPSMRDAWARLLEPDAAIVPQSARVYAAAVQSGGGGSHSLDDEGGWIFRYHPTALLQQSDGVAWKALLEDAGDSDSSAVVVPVHAAKLLRDERLHLLTEPACVLTIHLDKDRIPCERGQQQQVLMQVRRSGAVHGFLVWWELDLWRSDTLNEPSITYTMDPRDDTVPFQDHWQQCLHVLSKPKNALRGDTISILASHNDLSIQLEVLPASSIDESPRKRSRVEPTRPSFRAFSSERIYQLTDRTRSHFFRSAIAHALSSFSAKRTDLHVLDLSDVGYCGILAALHGTCGKVTSVESAAGGTTAEWTSRVAQASNLPKTCQFEILACHVEQLDVPALGGRTPNVVVAEPYYQVLEGWNLQEALNYYHLVRSLRRRSVLLPGSIALPGVCRVMACGVESCELRTAYGPCGDENASSVCGFDHGALNRNACFGQHTLSLPLWQYDYRRLTEEVEIGRLDYMDPREGSLRSSSTLEVRDSGMLDAIVIWLEYGYSRATTGIEPCPLRLSTDARSYRQGVRMMKIPVHVIHNAEPEVVVHFNFVMGGLNCSEDHMMDVHVGAGKVVDTSDDT